MTRRQTPPPTPSPRDRRRIGGVFQDVVGWPGEAEARRLITNFLLLSAPCPARWRRRLALTPLRCFLKHPASPQVEDRQKEDERRQPKDPTQDGDNDERDRKWRRRTRERVRRRRRIWRRRTEASPRQEETEDVAEHLATR